MKQFQETFDAELDQSVEQRAIQQCAELNELKRELQEKERQLAQHKNKIEDLLNHKHINQEGWQCNSSQSEKILESELKNLINEQLQRDKKSIDDQIRVDSGYSDRLAKNLEKIKEKLNQTRFDEQN